MQIFLLHKIGESYNTGPDLCLSYTGVNPVESMFKQLDFFGI